jgi:phenylacetate-coenzyme A ligase PaaK-like adenylate-forming protein
MFAAWRADHSPRLRQAAPAARLAHLLAYARAHSPLYRELWAGVDPAAPLSAYPRVTKAALMDRFDDWPTDRRVTRADVEAFMADPANEARLYLGEYLVTHSSGSSGAVVVVLNDGHVRHVGNTLRAVRRFTGLRDYGRYFTAGGRLACVFAGYPFHHGAGSSRLAQTRPFVRHYVRLTDARDPAAVQTTMLNRFRPAELLGYPNAVVRLAEEQLAGRLRIAPVRVTLNGEALSDSGLAVIRQAFGPGCVVERQYTSSEAGEIASACPLGRYHANDDWLILEPVDRSGRPVPDGEWADAWWLTNLANLTQPFVRYEVPDRILRHAEPCPCGRGGAWIEVEGRSWDRIVFESAAGPVTLLPVLLRALVTDVPGTGITDFQLRLAPGNAVALRLAAPDRDRAFALVRAGLAAYLEAQGVTASYELDPAPPGPDPVTGKFSQIIWLGPKEVAQTV